MMAASAERVQPAELLTVRDLFCSFGGVHAVNGVSFTVSSGSITGLIGPNGAGKSTVLNMIAGAIKPTAGSILVDCESIGGLASDQIARRGVARTFQMPAEFAQLTVLENLLVAAPDQRGETLRGALLGKRFWRSEERERIVEARQLLQRFALSDKENDRAGNLSGGQKRLLELMRVLMTRPKLLLLDEPMAGVNPSLAREIATYLLELRSEGYTMLLVEHQLRLVQRLCDDIIVMSQGEIIFQGDMPGLLRSREVQEAYLAG
jgi:ABC-type branched-subunit amino acid transport system ATPase component